MRLTIDTKTDSKDEIRKAIRLLMGLVGGAVYTNEPEKPKQQDLFEQPTQSMSNLMSIFDNPPEQKQELEKEGDVPTLEFY